MEEHIITHKRGCEVLSRFGVNPHGESLYRIVRADSRRQWQVGEFRPKYPKFGTSFVIEKWCEPEKYGSQAEWEDAKDENGVSFLGPFPRKGDYEFVLPVWDERDQPLTEPGEHHLQAIAWMVEKSAGLTRSQRWAQIQEAEDTAKEVRSKKLEAMIADAKPLRGGIAEQKYGEELEEAAKRAIAAGARKPMPSGASLSTGE